MGNFTLLPQKDKSYRLRVIGLNHDLSKFQLPQAILEGYTITVNNLHKDAIKVFVKHNFQQPDRAMLVAHQRGRVFYSAQIASDKKEYLFSIPKDSVPIEGVAHLTLFNGKGFPQCERIVYIQKNAPLNISIKPDKDSYTPREKVKLDITVQDQKGNPVKGNFSLAVVDNNQATTKPFSETIETYLLFSSDVSNILAKDVKGTIEQPGYYFDKKNPNAFIHLDLLLATQGWRRFSWTDVLGDSLRAPKHGLENGVTISGQVLQPNGKPAKNAVDLVFMIRGGFFTGSTNANGQFTLYDLDITDSTTLLVQGTKANGSKNVNVHINEPFIPPVLSVGSEHEKNFDRTQLESWLNRKRENDELMASVKLNKVQTLKEVEVRAKREEPDPRRIQYSSGHVSTIKVDPTQCVGAINVLQLLQGRVAGVQVIGTGLQMQIRIRGQEPSLMVDGMRMIGLDYLNQISPCDVEFIDILKEPSPLGFGGLISLLTRRGNSNYDFRGEKAQGITVNKVMGFDVAREFYSPKYETNAQPVVPDYRSTLYWQPMIKTDSNGKAHVEFWNSDEKTTINAILEGISTNGKPAATSFQYIVK